MRFRAKLVWVVTLGFLANALCLAQQQIVLRALMEDVPETRIIETLLPEFEKATGIKVEFEIMVYTGMYDKLVAQMLAPINAYDFIQVDFIWAGAFPALGWLEPLEPYVRASGFDLSPYLPSMLDLVGYYNGTLYMIPMYSYTMALIYRKDLLERDDLRAKYREMYGKELSVPNTLDEYLEVAKFMTDYAGVYGAAMQGMRGDPNFLEFANYLFAAGGDFIDENWNVVLNSPAGKRALSAYVRNIREVAPIGALNFNLDDTFRVMCAGEAWSFISYWWMVAQLQECPAVAGRVAIAPVPGGVGVNGGWGWAIPWNSPNKEAAWKFISWVESKDIVLRRALMGHAPTRMDVFQHPEVLAKYPHYEDVLPIIAQSKKIPIFLFTAAMQDEVGKEISLACTGEKTIEQALEDAAKSLERLIREAGIKK